MITKSKTESVYSMKYKLASIRKAGTETIRNVSLCGNLVKKNDHCFISYLSITVTPVLSGHSKIDQTKVLRQNVSLMTVESIAECLEHSAIF